MREMRKVTIGLTTALLLFSGCGGEETGGDGTDRDALAAELTMLAQARDYWTLQARLESAPELEGPRISLLRAEAAHAFNDPARSNRHLAELGAQENELSDSLRVRAGLLRFRNYVRLSEYAAAAQAGRTLLSLAAVDSTTRADVENETRAMEALVDVPPQQVRSRGDSEIRRRPDTRLPVQVEDSVRGYVFDTGANISTMMRSEAESLGLRIREVGMEVGTSTGSMVRADVTVASRVRLGDVELTDVVFLVVPDELLTFGPDFRIPGIIGFPVFDALGEVRFARGGVIRIPGEVPERPVHNLAMDYLSPLVRIDVLDDDAVCDLDTGANRTSLHLPFFERHRERISTEGRVDTVRTAGAGGERRIPGYMLEGVRIGLGDTAAVLPEVPVYTESVASGGGTGADCRLGLDVLGTFGGYLLNFRSMTFLPL